ncbi:GNAT family protein [Sedimentibacter sp.]|uniref:GNAT family N-acetyltransferase n=1 Tax=Sedimentibacter sp. TaxID=1960295 RepID=UPI00289FE6E5|nr:GNAT family protein [Sedimentibacter sp.]
MIETSNLNLIEAREEDIKDIMEMENHEDNRNFIWQGTYEQHLSEIMDKDYLLLIFKRKEDNLTVGFALNYLDYKSERFELRRIAVAVKGKGYGKEALNALIKYTFEDLKFNKFWLDVYPDNVVGIKLYENAGLHCDGVLRQNYKSERGFLDQKVYSMLRSEYEGLN